MNPFFNRQRITDPTYFQGQARQVEQLCSAIATHQCRALVGERKLGKSSLLTHVARPEVLSAYGLAPERHTCVYLDLEAMASAGRDDFWLELLEGLHAGMPDGDLRSAVAAQLDTGEVRFMTVRRLLRRLHGSGQNLVLCLDEFEALARNPRFEPDFYGELRSLAGEFGVVLLTASKRSLYDLTYEHADTLSSPFFNIFSELPLRLWPLPEARALLANLSALGARPFEPRDIEYLLDLAGPHPFFLQLAAAQLFDIPTGAGERPADAYELVRKRFLAEAEDHYRHIWSNLSPEEQSALLRVPQLSDDTERSLRAKALLRDRGDQPVPFGDGFAAFLVRHGQVAEQETIAPDADSSDLTGRTLGQYRVLALVGRGGMAEVYKGYQPLLDRYVAIKILLPHHAADAEFAERFQREATAIARLRHPNIVQVFDFGVQSGLTYMVMEYLGGFTLKERIAQTRQRNAAIPREETIAILADLAAALDYAHAHGLVHRDVKPANVLLREDPAPVEAPAQPQAFAAAFNPRGGRAEPTRPRTAVLTDFGVAKILEGVQLTASGTSLGTPDYMSPEQGRGAEVTPQSDIYALGVVCFELLTNQLPFAAETPLAVLLKHISDAPPPLRSFAPDLPAGLEAVLASALAKDPRQRMATAGELARAVEAAWPASPGATP